MTKSTITRERLEWLSQISCRDDIEDIGGDEIRELASMALAAMDSEPVTEVLSSRPGNDTSTIDRALPVGTTLYRHAQPALTKPVGFINGSREPVLYGEHIGIAIGAHLYADPQPAPERDQVRREHAAWSQATFGNVGPVGPLKHLSKEALEAAAEPGDLSEWADIQFLLWDAQRRAGITDEQITNAMIEKLAVNKQREWPEPKDGEPRLHIKEQPAPVVPEGLNPETTDLVLRFASALADKLYKAEQKYGRSTDWMKDDWYDDCLQSLWEHIEKGDPRDVAAYCAFMWYHGWVTTDYDRNVQNACRAACSHPPRRR